MSSFNLTEFDNDINTKFKSITRALEFKLENPPSLYYDVGKNMSYTTWCLSKYYTDSDKPKLYGPDFVVITYTYWHNENGYDECKQDEENEYKISSMVVIGHEYDKDVQPNWHDAASYHKYDYDNDDDLWGERW